MKTISRQRIAEELGISELELEDRLSRPLFVPWIRYRITKRIRTIVETEDTGEARCFVDAEGTDDDNINHNLHLEVKCWDEERFPLGMGIQLGQVLEAE